MAYTIYHSNSLPEFVEKYSNLFHSRDLFGDNCVTVVQNKNIASWLKLELTKVDGISMDLNVELPENAVKQLVLGYRSGNDIFNKEGNSKSLLFMDSLKIVLYKILEDLLADNTIFPNLYDYVQNSSSRLFQLSDSIAGLFYHYGMNCPEMVSSWEKGKLYENSLGKALRVKDQKWQMRLWNYVFNRNTPYLHISGVLNHVLNSGDSYDPALSPYGECKIILFGSTFLGESAIKFFNYLSRDVDVHHFLLTPSKIYAGEKNIKPLSLLSRFSGLINGFTTISRSSDFIKERKVFFKEIKGTSLLKKIQLGIRNNSLVESASDNPVLIEENDDSLRICKVTGKWREVEVLKDKILKLLDTTLNLKLTDIGVVAPDIGEYASYIEGVFSDVNKTEDGKQVFGKYHIPYNIIGLKGGEDSPYIKGILSLMELPGTTFNRRDIFNIISNPCFMERFNINQVTRDFLLETVDALHIKWGIDRDHKEYLGYTDDSFNTWEEGFRRFLLGIALKEEDHYFIPYSLNDSQAVESIGDLISIVRSLYSDLGEINKLSLKMDEWVLLIETIMETYLKPVKNDLFDERERLSVKHQYRNILNLFDDLKELENFNNRTLPFSVFKSLLKEFIIKAGNSRGRYLTQGVTFSSLKPLRAVPFKHIFVLGMNEDIFPGKEKVPSYDLRIIYDQKIDLSKRQNDKFAFLELILSARDSLTLFYHGKDQISGEELQPSVVINELLEAIECNFEKSDKYQSLIEEHPLQSFDSRYFKKDSKIKSFNIRAYESSKAYNMEKKPDKGIDLYEDRNDDNTIEISVRDLVNFVKNPVKSFYNQVEGIFLNGEDNLVEDIFENRDLDFLTKWKLANFALETGLKESKSLMPMAETFFTVAKLEGVYKDSLLTSNIREEVESLIESVDSFLKDKNLKESSFQKESRELNGEFNSINISIDEHNISIVGELENLWVGEGHNCFTAGISLGSNKEMKVKDKILPYIYSLIIFNHPLMQETKITAYSIGKENIEPVVFSKTNETEERLEKLLRLYLKNRNNPIPLFPDIMKSPDKKEVSKAWENSLDSTMVYSALADCPYVRMTYNTTPEFSEEDINDMYQAIYKELVPDKAVKT